MLPDTEEMRGFAALLGIAALSLAIAACGGSGQLPTATSIPSAPGSPAALASPSATSAPTAEEVSALELTHAGNVDMPDGLVLFVTSGCTGCDGPDTGIVRVYRAGDGVRIDTLFTLEKVGITSRLAYISGLVTNQEATDILISVCIPGGCYSLGHGDPDQQTALYRSKDGGVSWTQLALLGGDYRVVGLYRGAGILWNIPPGDYMAPGANLPREFLVFPEMSVLTPPEPDAIPLTNDPDLLWLSRDSKR
ncbi:MAG TPA: hypothetical protein VFB90_00080, partial [Dehalococcoidia bacterium]|nr:hypothetical protein [Dehalococcoidia bacterium]